MLKADHPVRVLDEVGNVGRRCPDAADRCEVLVGCPTGNCATLSNVYRDGPLEGFGDEVAQRWHTNPFEFLTGIELQEFGGIACEDDSCRLSRLDGAVHCEVPGNRGACGVSGSA